MMHCRLNLNVQVEKNGIPTNLIEKNKVENQGKRNVKSQVGNLGILQKSHHGTLLVGDIDE